jgi:hypothetical protein
MTDRTTDRPIPDHPIQDEPRYVGEPPTREDRANILRGWLETSGVHLGEYDTRILRWAIDAWDWPTFATITSWIRRANEAGRETGAAIGHETAMSEIYGEEKPS